MSNPSAAWTTSALQKLLADMRERRIDIFVVDRLTRTLTAFVHHYDQTNHF